MPLPDCREASVRIFQTAEGKWFERFILPNQYFDNEISSPNSATRTPAPQVFYDRGLCSVPTEPRTEIAVSATPINAQVTEANMVAANVASTFFLLALVGAGWWLYRRGHGQTGGMRPDYHPMSDLPRLPRLSELAGMATDGDEDGDEAEGDDEEEPSEFVPIQPIESGRIQPNSERNSDDRIPTYEEHYGTATDWPPSDMGGLYDPRRPEERNEFEDYCRLLNKHGFSPGGNEIVLMLWGAKPGGNKRYQAAVHRRDQFVRRLAYYQSEGA